jgi:hypothetical protein
MRAAIHLALLLPVLLTACGAQAPQSASDAKVETASEAASGEAGAVARKLIKTVDLDVQVSDTTEASEELRSLASEMGGYVSAMTAYRRNELLYYSLTLRVPVERLDGAVERIKSLATRVDRESIRTEDVTEKYIDLEARLTTLKATETELRSLLAESRERQHKAEDIMTIYEKLTEIRSLIEQIEGQLKALDSLATLSTINVQLIPTESAKPIVAEGWKPADTARSSTRALVTILQGLADVVIVALIVGVPLAVVLGLPVLAIAIIARRLLRRPSRAAAASQAP